MKITTLQGPVGGGSDSDLGGRRILAAGPDSTRSSMTLVFWGACTIMWFSCNDPGDAPVMEAVEVPARWQPRANEMGIRPAPGSASVWPGVALTALARPVPQCTEAVEGLVKLSH